MSVILEAQGEGGAAKAIAAGEWSDTDTRVLLEADVKALELNRDKGFRGTNVDFVAELPRLQELELIDFKIDDIAGINALPNLKRLTVSTYARTPIDFSTFADLEECFLEWVPGSDSVFDCGSLRDLYINRFPESDLRCLAPLTKLSRLRLGNGAKAISVAGVDRLASLRHLGLYRMPKLVEWQPLSQLTQLEGLDIHTCRRIDSLDFLRPLRSLRQLALVNCGPIESLAPLAGAEALETFFFYESTNVRDGDLSILLALPRLRDVSFMNRKHYSHTREQIRGQVIPEALANTPTP